MLTVDYDRLGVGAGDRVLDVGCGRGRHAFEAYRRGADVVAVDLGDEEVAETASWLRLLDGAGAALVVRGDARTLPFPDATFDRVIAAEILEHVDDDAAILAELRRSLRTGGLLAVTVPRWWPEAVCWRLSREYHAPAADGGHVRIYRRRQLRARIAAAGFRLLAGEHHAHALHSPYWWLRCLVGPDRHDHPVVAAYHRFLVWDLERRPRVTRAAERLLDPVVGKSYVVYARAV